MIEYREALDIASRFYEADIGYVLIRACRTTGGWMFEFSLEGLDPSTVLYGGPEPVFVSAETGEAVAVVLPSDEGFEILHSIVEEDLEI